MATYTDTPTGGFVLGGDPPLGFTVSWSNAVAVSNDPVDLPITRMAVEISDSFSNSDFYGDQDDAVLVTDAFTVNTTSLATGRAKVKSHAN